MRRVFKTRYFGRWMRKTELTDADLCKAVEEMEGGLIDAELGGGMVKKRVALPGRGKRGSARTLVATNKDDRWFFAFGFEKNELSNIGSKALESLQKAGKDLLKLPPADLNKAVAQGMLEEICNG